MGILLVVSVLYHLDSHLSFYIYAIFTDIAKRIAVQESNNHIAIFV